MPELLWRSERPCGAGAHYELYRVADGSLHLTVNEGFGANLTEEDRRRLLEVLTRWQVAAAFLPGQDPEGEPAG